MQSKNLRYTNIKLYNQNSKIGEHCFVFGSLIFATLKLLIQVYWCKFL